MVAFEGTYERSGGSSEERTHARLAGNYASLIQLGLDEPALLKELETIAGELASTSSLESLLSAILGRALSVMKADFGNVQLLDGVSGCLTIAAESGFDSQFLEHFRVVDDDSSACGRASRRRAQLVIPDVTTDPGFTPHREIAVATGFRSVQSTPLADAGGRLIGVVSTHWRQPGRPPVRDMAVLGFLGDLAGEALTRMLKIARFAVAPLHEQHARQRADWLDGRVATPGQEELADQIVHRMFAAGLSLASAQSIAGQGPAGERIAEAVSELDRAIRDIRIQVFSTSAWQAANLTRSAVEK